jgi:hypothetical protein
MRSKKKVRIPVVQSFPVQPGIQEQLEGPTQVPWELQSLRELQSANRINIGYLSGKLRVLQSAPTQPPVQVQGIPE